MKRKKYRILVVEKETPFRDLLCRLLKREMSKHNTAYISLTESCNVPEEESYNEPIDMIFIDLLFLSEQGIEIIKKIKQKNPQVIVVILISDQGASHVKAIIEKQKELSHYFVDEFILKDNYSVGLLVVFCSTLIKNMLSNTTK